MAVLWAWNFFRKFAQDERETRFSARIPRIIYRVGLPRFLTSLIKTWCSWCYKNEIFSNLDIEKKIDNFIVRDRRDVVTWRNARWLYVYGCHLPLCILVRCVEYTPYGRWNRVFGFFILVRLDLFAKIWMTQLTQYLLTKVTHIKKAISWIESRVQFVVEMWKKNLNSNLLKKSCARKT